MLACDFSNSLKLKEVETIIWGGREGAVMSHTTFVYFGIYGLDLGKNRNFIVCAVVGVEKGRGLSTTTQRFYQNRENLTYNSDFEPNAFFINR